MENTIDTGTTTGKFVNFDDLLIEQKVNKNVAKSQVVKSTLSPLVAIRSKCLDCAGTWHEVKHCDLSECSLHLLRFGNQTLEEISRVKAIRQKCMSCMNGMKEEIKSCIATDCPLYPLHFGKGIPKGKTNRVQAILEKSSYRFDSLCSTTLILEESG